MDMTTPTSDSKGKQAKKNERKRIEFIYHKRFIWVDIPTFFMIASYHWDFHSRGSNPIPNEIIFYYWAVLCVYWIIKEKIRHSYNGIIERPGGIYVVLWGIVLAEFGFLMQLKPGVYHMPGYLVTTCIFVLLGYVGILAARRFFATLFPNLVDAIDNTINDKT